MAAVTLCKVVAAGQAAAIAVLLLVAGRRRETLYPLAGAALGGVLYILYGWWQGWEPFREVMSCQANRFTSPFIWQTVLSGMKIVHVPTFSFLVLLGWMCLVACAAARRGRDVFLAPLVFAAVWACFADVNRIFGWHILPFLPFLCLAMGWVIWRVAVRCEIVPWLILSALVLPYAVHCLVSWFPICGELLARPFYVLVALPALLLPFFGDEARRWTIRTFLCVMVVLVLCEEVRIASSYPSDVHRQGELQTP